MKKANNMNNKLRNQFILAGLFFVFLLTQSAFGAGKEKDRIVWEGQITLNEDVVIENTQELIIKPGAQIDFKTFKLTVYGKLIANGNPFREIKLYSSDPTGWKGIHFEDEYANGSVLNYCQIINLNNYVMIDNNRSLGIDIWFTRDISISNCRFTDNSCGISLIGSKDLIIKNNKFANNTIHSSSLISINLSRSKILSCSFEENEIGTAGLISITNNSLLIFKDNQITETTFLLRPKSYLGGGELFLIKADDNGDDKDNQKNMVQFEGNHFSNNEGNRDIYLTGKRTKALFINNTFHNTVFNNSKCAIYLLNAEAKVTSSYFNGYTRSALHFYVYDAIDISIINNNFENNFNIIDGNGGAINIEKYEIVNNATEFSVIGNTFINNNSTNGGAIFLKGISDIYYSKLNINSNVFASNQSGNVGGAILIEFADISSMEGNTMLNNTGQEGGAICVDSCYVEIFKENALISNNSIIRGGGVYFKNSHIFLLNDNYFENNETEANGAGGGLSFYNSSTDILINNTFINNKSGSGGAIDIMVDDSVGLFKMAENKFFRNTAGFSGGAIFFDHNRASTEEISMLEIYNNSFFNNSAVLDGGVLHISNCEFHLTNSKLYYNEAQCGGGVWLHNLKGDSFIKDNILYSNKATNNGGGLYLLNLEQPNLLTLTDNVIGHNYYGVLGGGLFMENCANLVLKRNIINYSHAMQINATEGGGVYLLNSSIQMYNCNIHGNEVAYNKGSITFGTLNSNNLVRIENCNIIKCPEGGGIRFPDIQSNNYNNVTIYNTIFFYNGGDKSFLFEDPVFPTPGNRIKAYNCWMYQGEYLNYNPYVSFIDLTQPYSDPGWMNQNNYNLTDESTCIDKGYNLPFNGSFDMHIPPGRETEIADIGVSGGNNNPDCESSYALNVLQVQNIDPTFTADHIGDGAVEISVDLPAQPGFPVYYHWFFGDGSTSTFNYNQQPSLFTHQYDQSLFDEITITLMIETPMNMNNHDVVVNIGNPATKQGLFTEINFSEDVLDFEHEYDGFQVFPNPSNGMLTVSPVSEDKPKEDLWIVVFNHMGHEILRQKMRPGTRNQKVNISNQDPGLYFLSICGGSARITKKIILN